MKLNSLPEGLNLKELKLATPPTTKRACGGTCDVVTCCRTTGKRCCSAVPEIRHMPTLMNGSPELVSGLGQPKSEEAAATPQTPEA